MRKIWIYLLNKNGLLNGLYSILINNLLLYYRKERWRGIFPKDLTRKQVRTCVADRIAVAVIAWSDQSDGAILSELIENGRARAAGPGGRRAVPGEEIVSLEVGRKIKNLYISKIFLFIKNFESFSYIYQKWDSRTNIYVIII